MRKLVTFMSRMIKNIISQTQNENWFLQIIFNDWASTTKNVILPLKNVMS